MPYCAEILTRVQIVYLPDNPIPELQSFSSPILNLQDTFVRAPFFGANYWTASCKPVPEGGISLQHGIVELKLTFKEGGAFDFHTTFEQIKERLYQAQMVARENGQRGAVDVDLEQLPAYEAAREERENTFVASPVPVRPQRHGSIPGISTSEVPISPPPVAPDEAPPGYEEAQAQTVRVQDLDQRLREEEGRRNS